MRRKRATAATTRFGRRKRSGREFKKRARAAGLQLKPPPPFPGEPVFPKVGSPLKKKAAPVPIRECRSWDLDQITRARIRAFTPPVLGLGAKLQGTECGRAGWDHTRTGLYECTRVVRREIKAEAISGAGGGESSRRLCAQCKPSCAAAAAGRGSPSSLATAVAAVVILSLR